MSIWTWDYRPHAAFVEPARARVHLWRVAFGIILIAAIFLALSQMIFGTILSALSPSVRADILGSENTGQTPGAVLFMLCQLGLLGVATAFVCMMLHNRQPGTLFGPVGKARQQFLSVSVILAIVVGALFLLPPYGYGEPLVRNLNFGLWLALLPFALIALLLQVGAEEVLFRGYLQQQLAARFDTPLVWMLVPSLLFAWLHYLPQSAGSNALTIAVLSGVFGLIAADLTARSGTLGPAIALHLFNNIQAILFVSPKDSMSGLALYTLPFGLEDEARLAALLPVDLGWMLVAWLAARLAIRA